MRQQPWRLHQLLVLLLLLLRPLHRRRGRLWPLQHLRLPLLLLVMASAPPAAAQV
jgi:hypothetical protein